MRNVMAREQRIEGPAAGTTPAAPGVAGAESAGVDALIGRLRDQGIAQGRAEAEALVNAGRLEAAELVAAARREAEEIVIQAKADAEKQKAAAEAALALSARDTALGMESALVERFQNMLRRLVKGTLVDPTFLQRLILEVAGEAAPRAGKVEVLLPASEISLEDLQKKPEEAKPGTLMHFVLSLGGGVLREGVTFGVGDDVESGIRVKLVGEDMHVELTATAIGELLVRHALPRFRALLRGAVVLEGGVGPGPAPVGKAAPG
jgi:V/A-type H+-transporting ATPase subunit E